VVKPGIRETKVVTETRQKTYEARGGGRETFRGRRPIGRRARRQQSFDKGGHGTEIVREISVCPKCAEQFRAEAEAQQAQEAQALEASGVE
jgi:hypothetical protein